MAAQHAPSPYEEASFTDGAPPAVVASEPAGILPAVDESAAMPESTGLPAAQMMMESQAPQAPAAERAATLFDAAEEEHKARALSFEPSAEGEHSLSAKTADTDEHLARLQAVALKEQDLAALEENLHQREKQLLLQQEHLQAQADILQSAAVERERDMRQREESLRQREQQLTTVEGRMLAEESQIQMELDSVRSREAQLRIEEERIVEIENELRIREQSTSELEARLALERELSQAKEAKSPDVVEGEVYVSDLLEIAGFLHAGELDKAINNVLKHPASAVELLRFLGLVDEDALEALTECLNQMHDGELSASEVVQSLAEFRETGALSRSSAFTQNEGESPSGGQAEFSALDVLDMSPPVEDAKEADDDGESHSTLASSDDGQIQSLEPLPESLPESSEAAEPPNAIEVEQAPESTFVVPVQDDKFTHTGIYDVFVDLDDPEGDPYYLAARAAIESDSLPKADTEPDLEKANDSSLEEAFSQTISAVMVEDLIEEPVSEKSAKASKDKKDKRKGRAQSGSTVEENRSHKQAVTESASESPDATVSDESLKIQKKSKEAESVQKPSKKDTKGKSSKGKSRSRK